MRRALPSDPDELRQHAAELQQAILLGFKGGAFFPPIAGVAVEIGFGRVERMLQGIAPADHEDVLGLYALAHESIHLAQLITSRWFFSFVRDLAQRATWAAHYESIGKVPEGWREKGKRDFGTLTAGLTKIVDGFSALEVLETQAVIEGLWGAMPKPSAEAVVYAAVEIYEPRSIYRHILDHLVDSFGAEAAVALGPKLCTIALQFDEPGGVMSDLLRDLDDAKGSIDILVRMPPAKLLEARRLDPHAVSRSCRELSNMSETYVGDFLAKTIVPEYFDEYEALGEEARLAAMMHPGRLGGYVGAGKPIFMPMYVLFGDGQCLDAKSSGRNITDFAQWVDLGLAIRDGMAWLS